MRARREGDNRWLDEAQAGIMIAGRNINNLRYAMTPPLFHKELKSPFMKVTEESKKLGLNLNFRKVKSWHPVSSLHGK